MSSPRFIICGSLTFDNVLTAEGIVRPQTYGGNVVYAALGARLWHESIGIVSRAGMNFPESFLEEIADAGIDTAGVQRVDRPHALNVAFYYYPDGSRDRAFPPGAMDRIIEAERKRFIDHTTLGGDVHFKNWTEFSPKPTDIPDAWIGSCQGIHLAAMPVQTHLALSGFFRNNRSDVIIQVDSPWYDERDLSCDFQTELFRCIDTVLPSEADLQKQMPEHDSLAAGRSLSESGARFVVVKQGGAGSTIIDRKQDQIIHIPACPVEVVDPTGAGDAFCGGFLVGYVETGDIVRAAAYGTVSASFAIEHVGVLPIRDVTRKHAEERLYRLLKLIECK